MPGEAASPRNRGVADLVELVPVVQRPADGRGHAVDAGWIEQGGMSPRGLAHAGDVLVVLSTSGTSDNVVRATAAAKELQLHTIAFTGEGGGALAEHAELLLDVPSTDTGRVQEMHILLGHLLCELVETQLDGEES